MSHAGAVAGPYQQSSCLFRKHALQPFYGRSHDFQRAVARCGRFFGLSFEATQQLSWIHVSSCRPSRQGWWRGNLLRQPVGIPLELRQGENWLAVGVEILLVRRCIHAEIVSRRSKRWCLRFVPNRSPPSADFRAHRMPRLPFSHGNQRPTSFQALRSQHH